ncbi:hypothetical protein BH10CYA1_BH10CYA1_04100 [soil metagenome]
MTERYDFQFDENNGISTKSELPQIIKSEEHSSIISAIARCDQDEKLTLPKLLIWERQTAPSPIDELRKHIAHHDQIRPFTPFPEKIPQVLANYDPSKENYWKAVQETIDSWKHPSMFDAFKAPHAKPGFHFELNPNTGKVVERKDRLTMEYRPDEDGYQDGRPQYEVDPRTGAIVQGRKIHTLEWREDRDGWRRKDHYYGLNRETGRIELRPNVRTMDFRSN